MEPKSIEVEQMQTSTEQNQFSFFVTLYQYPSVLFNL